MNREELKALVAKTIDARKDLYVALGKKIYDHPETGYREVETTKVVAEALAGLGFPVEKNIAITGCRAHCNVDKKGPKVVVMGELDALLCPTHPDSHNGTGAMHACGHNIQVSVMYGVADALTKAGILDKLEGKIDFMAVPAEEVIELDYRQKLKAEGKIRCYSGKPELITRGAFDDTDICMMVHNFPFEEPGMKVAPFTSSNGFIGKQTTFIGKQAHAGQAPWDGINALNMASLAITNMHYQRETFRDKDTVRVHQILTDGGQSFNSVPEKTRLETAIRANSLAALLDANKKVNRSIQGATIAIGGKAQVVDSPGMLPIVPSEPLAAIFKENALKFYKEEEIMPKMQWTACSDMGDVSMLKPVLHGLTGGITGGLHTAEYKIADLEDAYITPIKIMAFTLIDLLTNDATLANKVIKDFKPIMTKAEYLAYLDEIEKIYEL